MGMRAMLAVGFVVGLGMVASEAAEAARPTPEELVSQARVDRSAFDTAMFEAKALIPTLETKAEAGPYLMILDELYVIQRELGFSIFDASPLGDFADKLTMYVERWLDLGEDSPELVASFARWSSETVRATFCLTQARVLAGATDKAPLLRMAALLGVAIGELKRESPLYQGVSQIVPDYERLQGTVHRRLLEQFRLTLTLGEYQRFLAELHGPEAIQGAAESLHRDAYTSRDVPGLAQSVRFATLMDARIREFPGPLPAGILDLPAAIASDALVRILALGGVMSAADAKAGLAIADAPQLDRFASRLLGLRLEHLAPVQLPLAASLAAFAAERYADFAMTTESLGMLELEDKLRLAIALDGSPLEGIYDAQIDGRPAVITIVRTGVASLAVGASLGGGVVSLALTNARLDRATGAIEVDSLAAPNAGAANRFARFRQLPGTESIEGIFHNGVTTQALRGRRIHELEDYMRAPTAALATPEGTYYGRLGGHNARLTVRRSGSTFLGTLIIAPESHRVTIQLDQCHFDPRNGALYLTARAAGDGVFVQLRGTVGEAGFEGSYVVGNRTEVLSVQLPRS